MRFDRIIANMRKVITYEKERGHGTEEYELILHLYTTLDYTQRDLNKICDNRSVSNENKKYFTGTLDYDRKIEAFYANACLSTETKEMIANAYRKMQVFTEKLKNNDGEIMRTANNFTRNGTKPLREIASDFGKATGAISREMKRIFKKYPELDLSETY